jgi:ArsR family transcriptional regulator, arsenate/arsenite/antimonite-responsive transcriptional repressor
MAFSKAPLFDQEVFKQSFWSKALSHPARIIILSYLLENGITAFYILAKKVPLAKPTVSQHLRYLREAGLVDSFEKYPHTYYKINKNLCQELAQKIQSLQVAFAANTDDKSNPPLLASSQG